MGRPRKTDALVTVSVRLRPEFADWLTCKARDRGATRSSLIEYLLVTAAQVADENNTDAEWRIKIRQKFAGAFQAK
jgi:hypothetical protein